MTSIYDLFSLKGKTAFVTGASEWIGWDISCALAEVGADIAISSRSQQKAEDAASRLKAEFPEISTLGVAMDQCSSESVDGAFEKVRQWKGKLDILVNNAGGGSGESVGHILKRSPEDIETLLRTNLTGVMFCSRNSAKIMAEQNSGVIISIASMAGLIGRDRRMYERSGMNGQPVDYAAAKAGVIGMTRDLAASLGPYNVRVNAISPGGFDKGALPEKFTNELADATILGRWGKMGVDLKGAAVYLASEASAYVTGHNLVVDGGFSIFR